MRVVVAQPRSARETRRTPGSWYNPVRGPNLGPKRREALEHGRA